ncbi:hypothetical protein ABEB36_007802 [Hypothenemus hampei]|uniref:Uncharacterized protein n=1 Tax=Hypothenemus hampei TaxID=57062 RepID=A0ABD1EYA8_HYPHA
MKPIRGPGPFKRAAANLCGFECNHEKDGIHALNIYETTPNGCSKVITANQTTAVPKISWLHNVQIAEIIVCKGLLDNMGFQCDRSLFVFQPRRPQNRMSVIPMSEVWTGIINSKRDIRSMCGSYYVERMRGIINSGENAAAAAVPCRESIKTSIINKIFKMLLRSYKLDTGGNLCSENFSNYWLSDKTRLKYENKRICKLLFQNEGDSNYPVLPKN